MPYKFERLEVWQLALEYGDLIYKILDTLPHSEDFNLKAQMRRAVTSIALNIAEGSTGQSDPEQNRFLGLALRSLIETVACLRWAQRKNIGDASLLEEGDAFSEKLFAKISAFRNALK